MNYQISQQQKIVHAELSYTINGLLFKVHNELGRFEKEKRYGNLFEQKLLQSDLQFVREQKLSTGDYADFIIEKTVLIELKAKRAIVKDDYNQVQRYLKCSGIRLAMIINFRNRYLKPIRVLNGY